MSISSPLIRGRVGQQLAGTLLRPTKAITLSALGQ